MAKFANTKGLSKQEKYIVQGMLLEDNTTEDIAKYLDRELELVEGFIEDISIKPIVTEDAPVQEEVVNKLQHIINKTAKGNRGVAIMTPTASERSDGKNQGRGLHTARNAGYTHKIHE